MAEQEPLYSPHPRPWDIVGPILLGAGLFACTSALGIVAGFWSSTALSSTKPCVSTDDQVWGITWLILLLIVALGANIIANARRPALRHAAVTSDLALGLCSTVAAFVAGIFYSAVDGRATSLVQVFWLIAPTLLYFAARAPSYIWSGPGWQRIILRSLAALLIATIAVGAILWSVRSPSCAGDTKLPGIGEVG